MRLLKRGFRGDIRGAKPPEKRFQSIEAGSNVAPVSA
jgi:hypothetical protein